MGSFSEWTFSGNGSGALDASIKYAGNSSYKSDLSIYGNPGVRTNSLTRNAFSCANVRAILWRRMYIKTGSYVGDWSEAHARINHPSYGDLDVGYVIASGANATQTLEWEKFRVTFWYDNGSNKWGRVEKWVTDAWVQQGTDTNFGTGAPANASLVLKQTTGYLSSHSNTVYTWFDEIEVYTA